MITVAGISPSLDITYLVDALRLGEIHRPTSVVRCAGGKSLNMARAATTVGSEVSVVALLGGQTGAWIADGLRHQGVVVHEVSSPAETRTCVSIAAADSNELTEIYEHAPAVPADVWDHFVSALREAVEARPGWLSISGGAPKGLPPTALADLVGLGREFGIAVAVDTHSAALVEAVSAQPTLVKINRVEAAGLLSVPVDTDLAAMAAAVRERTGGVVVLTDGAAGALGLDGDGVTRVPMPGARGHYPVGSGDSFLGGLLSGLDSGASLSDALRTATACGVANALVPGPGQFEAESVREITRSLAL